MIKDHALAAEARAWEDGGAREIRATAWTRRLERCLRYLGKTRADITADRKSAPWKTAIAAHLKQHTQVPSRWLCEQLGMGPPVSVSQLVGQARRQPGRAQQLRNELTENIKTCPLRFS